MSEDSKQPEPEGAPLLLAAIHDEELWQELSGPLMKRYSVRRETDGLRAMNVLLLLRPVAVIAETGLPGLSGILLSRLIGHNRHLAKLPVALILSREYLIEEFWAKESGAVATVARHDARAAIAHIESALKRREPVTAEDWHAAESAIRAHGGPAAGVANELERQLIGASILARLGEIEIGGEAPEGETQGTIPLFIGQALGALASVLEFAQAGVALFESGELFVVENEVFADVLDEETFVRESRGSAKIYAEPEDSEPALDIIKLPPVHYELVGPRGPASTFFALPLAGRRGVYGLVSLMTYKDIAVREYYLNTLSLIGAQLAVTLERALFYEEVRQLSVTDHITGISNSRAIFARIEEEFRRSLRYRSPLSIAIADLDDFKLLNDKHGHQAGDAVLRGVATIIKESVREVDLAGRWGGEEMALIFPETDLDGAMTACDRVREQIAQHEVEFQDVKLQTAVSFGVATLDPNTVCPRSPGALVGLADRAMYLAKERGKNQVASFMDLPEAPAIADPSSALDSAAG